MTPLLILTHGEFGVELLKAAEAMLGPQGMVRALALHMDESSEDFSLRAQKVLAAWPESPLALVDVACGTPWNVAVKLGLGAKGDVLAGLSLPVLMEALDLRQSLGPAQLSARLKQCGAESLMSAAELLARGREESR